MVINRDPIHNAVTLVACLIAPLILFINLPVVFVVVLIVFGAIWFGLQILGFTMSLLLWYILCYLSSSLLTLILVRRRLIKDLLFA